MMLPSWARTGTPTFLHNDIMEINIEKINECQANLTATTSAAEASKIKAEVAKKYSSNASVPGFRPGKAPKAVIAKRYAVQIEEEAANSIKGTIQEQTLSENPELKILNFGTPEGGFQEDGSYTLSTELTIVPDFELPNYLGLKITVPSTDVSEEEVEKMIQQFAESNAKHETVERAAAMGDLCVIDFKTSVEGKATAEFCGKTVGFMEGSEGHWLSMEEDAFLPGLAEGLIGLNAGESKDVVLTMKEDFPIAELSGKEITFSCTVTEVKEKLVPEINAELFESQIPGKSIEEIKDIIRENMKANKERSNEELKTEQIAEQIADQLSFTLPEALVANENESNVQRKIYAAIQAGNYEITKDMEKLKADSMTETERNMRVYFALQEIARKENVEVTDGDLIQRISEMAEQAQEKDLRKYIAKLQKENQITGIRLSIVTAKVLELLAGKAVVEMEAASSEVAQ